MEPLQTSIDWSFHTPKFVRPLLSMASLMAHICKYINIWVFPKIGVPQIIISSRVFPYKPYILGAHPYFWKHPYIYSFNDIVTICEPPQPSIFIICFLHLGKSPKRKELCAKAFSNIASPGQKHRHCCNAWKETTTMEAPWRSDFWLV